MTTDKFVSRHNGPREHEVQEMLKTINAGSIDELIEQTVPPAIRLKQPLRIAPAMSEYQYLRLGSSWQAAQLATTVYSSQQFQDWVEVNGSPRMLKVPHERNSSVRIPVTLR